MPEPVRINLKRVFESLLEDGKIDATLSTMTDSAGMKIAERLWNWGQPLVSMRRVTIGSSVRSFGKYEF